MNSTTGSRIADLRRLEGLTQREVLARLKKEHGIEIGTSFLSQIESDKKKPSIELVRALADVLNASIDYILLRDDDPSPSPNNLSLVIDAASPEELRLLRIIVNEVQAIAPDDQETLIDVVRLFSRTIARRKQRHQ